jgi:hypothetical protein
MRHTFASFAIAAGVSLFYFARLMGSSVEQIDRTYGHLLPDSEDYLRSLLDSYDYVTVKKASAATTIAPVAPSLTRSENLPDDGKSSR